MLNAVFYRSTQNIFPATNLGYRINLFNRNLSRAHYVSGTVPGAQDTSVNRRGQIPAPPGAWVLVGDCSVTDKRIGL